jgi:hypothetical protein
MEEKSNPNSQPASNAHARQTFWQIYFPLLLAILGIAVIFFLIFGRLVAGGTDLRVWADIGAILIILPLFLVLLVLIALTLVGSALTYKVSGAMNTGLAKIRQFTLRVAHGVVSASNGIHKTWDEVDALCASIKQKYL